MPDKLVMVPGQPSRSVLSEFPEEFSFGKLQAAAFQTKVSHRRPPVTGWISDCITEDSMWEWIGCDTSLRMPVVGFYGSRAGTTASSSAH